jgi:5-formyltetrahydrofolate cyclo-ligase
LTSPFPGAPSLPLIRRDLRQARRHLSPQDQRLHARALARLLGKDPVFLRARSLAAYWAADGELDPGPLLALARRRGRRTFLPVLRRASPGRLWFLAHRPGESMRPNRFGIPEPRHRSEPIRLPWHLDLILMPLVGFDPNCNRLGMGGGFYDRTLAYLRHRSYWRRPRLIGIAHECQRLARIEPRPWDIPLDGVATERRIYWRRGLRAEDQGPARCAPLRVAAGDRS